jgi:CheY-like chemotaxis protein
MFFTISLKETTTIELADIPIGLDDTSSYRHLWSLREFINTLISSNSIRILIAMQKQKMSDFLGRFLRKASVMDVIIADSEAVSCENALISEIIKQEPTIMITDLAHEDELKKCIVNSLVKGVILLDGEQESRFFDDGKAFRSIRKPVKPAVLVKTLHEMLLSVLSHFQSVQKTSVGEGEESSMVAPKSKWLNIGSDLASTEASSIESISKSKVAEQEHEVLRRPTDLSSSSFAKAYPLRLMLAEDNLLNQQLMTRILAKYGYVDLIVVDNGRQAFEVFRRTAQQPQEKTIQGIFMDMQMPEVEGPEATHLIRTFCRQTGCPQPHIMVLTAKAFSEDRAECMRAGMCSYLSKPIRWSTLEEELIKAYETVHDRINCTCNEDRMNEIVFETKENSGQVGGNRNNLNLAKSTGLDV